MKDKYNIDWENVTKIDEDTHPIALINKNSIKISFTNGDIKTFTPDTFYSIPNIPDEEIIAKYKIDSEGRPILGNFFTKSKNYKKIKSYYKYSNSIPSIRENGYMVVPHPDSTWQQEQIDKQKYLWEDFSKYVKLQWNKTKPKRIKNLLQKISERENTIKLRQERIKTDMKYNERYMKMITQITDE